MNTIHCRKEFVEFYHGSCTAAGIESMLLPPCDSDTLSEKAERKI